MKEIKLPVRALRNWEGYGWEPDEDELVEYQARPFTRIEDADGATVVNAHDLFEFRPGHAETIVALLNACEGIEDPRDVIAGTQAQLAAYVNAATVTIDAGIRTTGGLADAVKALVAQRDGLAAALQEVKALTHLDCGCAPCTGACYSDDARQMAREISSIVDKAARP